MGPKWGPSTGLRSSITIGRTAPAGGQSYECLLESSSQPADPDPHLAVRDPPQPDDESSPEPFAMFPPPLGSTDPRLPRILSLNSHPAMATLPPDCAQEPLKTLHSPCLVHRSVPRPGELWGRGLPFHLPTGCSGDMPTSCPRSPGHTGGQASPASCLITQGSHLEPLSQYSCFPPSHR